MVPALAVPAIGASLAFAAPAFAVATSCTTLGGTESAATLSGCNDGANTGGSGTFGAVTHSPGTVSWASGGTNTFSFTYKDYTSGKKDKCGAGSIYVELKGKITGHTGAGSSVTGKVKADICLNDTTLALSLKSGSFSF